MRAASLNAASGLKAALDAAEADARRHKRAAKQHRMAAQEAAARREQLKTQLAEMGIALVSTR